MHEFFFIQFCLARIFFLYFARPPPHKFSNGPSLTLIKLSASPPLSEQQVLLSAVGHFGASVVQLKMADGVEIVERKSCAFFLKRKNRFCRMTVGGGRRYCGEHMVVAGEAEVRNLFLFLRHCFGSTYSFSTSL